jgi:hypothetical protein
VAVASVLADAGGGRMEEVVAPWRLAATFLFFPSSLAAALVECELILSQLSHKRIQYQNSHIHTAPLS